MGINSQSTIETNLQIGPTDRGMVRIYVETDKINLPMDFDADDAEEIAAELMSAAKAVRTMHVS